MDASSFSPELISVAKQHVDNTCHDIDKQLLFLSDLKELIAARPKGLPKFTLKLTPKTGYGVVTCTRDNYGLRVKLGPCPTFVVKDGGKAQGYGALHNYRAHIDTAHPYMKAEKKDPMLNESSSITSKGKQRASAAAFIDIPSSSPAKQEPAPMEGILDTPPKPARALTKVKPEPFPMSLPPAPVTPTKRPASPLQPFNSPSRTGRASGSKLTGELVNTEDTREAMVDLQRQISQKTAQLDKLLFKKYAKRTKGEHTRIANLQRELGDLRDKKAVLSNSLPTLPPPPKKRRTPVKPIGKADAENKMEFRLDDLHPPPLDRPHQYALTSPVRRDAKASLPVSAARVKREVVEPKIEPQDFISIPPETPTSSIYASSYSARQMEDIKPKLEAKPDKKPRLPSLALSAPPPRFPVLPSAQRPQTSASAGPSRPSGANYAYDPASDSYRVVSAGSILDDRITLPPDSSPASSHHYDTHASEYDSDAMSVGGMGYGGGLGMGDADMLNYGHAAVARADDIEKFIHEAGNALQFQGNQSVAKALADLNLPDITALLAGMVVPLMPHRVIGLAWMIKMEANKQFKGGCLGDEMGLGKTVQMIALMTHRLPEDPKRKTTLIVASVALLDQWALEMETKTDLGSRVLIYHGQTRERSRKHLMEYDVVITTYGVIANEFPDFESDQKAKAQAKRKKPKLDSFVTSDSEDEAYGRSQPRRRAPKRGLLFQAHVEFHRIILDEAQTIRNKGTRASRAVTELQATYRWCLTGTAIINTLCDVYPLFRFLKIRPWYDWDEFRSRISCHEKKNPNHAIKKLQPVLATIMLRRRKDTELDGKRLVELPEKTVDMLKLTFSPEEQEIYQMLETKQQAIFSRYLRAGTVLKNYHHVLSLLLRLRQVCNHPALISEDNNAFIKADELKDERVSPELRSELARARALVSNEFVARMREKRKQAALARRRRCPICFECFTDPVVTSCTHSFCRECITNIVDAPRPDGLDNKKYAENQRACPQCRSAISAETLFTRAAFEPTDAELQPGAPDIDLDSSEDELPLPPRGKARKRKSNKRRVDLEDDMDDDMDDFIVDDDEDVDGNESAAASGDGDDDDDYVPSRRSGGKARAIVISSDEEDLVKNQVIFGVRKAPKPTAEQIPTMDRFLPSTKMKEMMKHLKQLRQTKPDEKILIISQWTSCLSLVSDYLIENGMEHVKYQGNMTRNNRDMAVRTFMSREKARIMLLSLKCGGAGLKLTRANNVISLDLGWSAAIEAQAFDRVHRLGQNRPVQVHRLVIENTVEDRILALQDRKQLLADGSLGEGQGKKLGRLSVKELASLFGLDHHGRLLE